MCDLNDVVEPSLCVLSTTGCVCGGGVRDRRS